jgi:hypothetical protein
MQMTGIRRPRAGIIALLVMLAVGDPMAPAVAAASNDVARDILAQPRYQTSLPDSGADDGTGFGLDGDTRSKKGAGQGDTGQDSPGANGGSDRTANRDDTNGSDMPAAPTTGAAQIDVSASALTRSILSLIPALAIAGLLLLLAYLGFKFWRNRRRASRPKAAPTTIPQPQAFEPMPTAEISERLPAWQVLANQGRFTEAIHLLLLHVLQDMRGEGLVTLTQSLTSREILRTSDLAAERRSGLATIIGAVEFCHFGGRAAGLALYEKCLAAYLLATSRTPSHAATE